MIRSADISRRILIVDDQEANVSLLEKMLRAPATFHRVHEESRESASCTQEPLFLICSTFKCRLDGFQVMEV